jgi:hypothetical protein
MRGAFGGLSMTTVASPVSVRDQALAIIGRRLNAEPALQDRLAGIGGAAVADILFKLETAFGIGLDVDEVLPNGTIGVLVELTERRAAARGRVVHWDDERLRRGLPYCGPRPEPAPISAVAIVLPPWPDAYAAPSRRPCAQPIAGCAVPGDEAWMVAIDTLGREDAARRRILIAACLCVPFGSGALAYWLLTLFAR